METEDIAVPVPERGHQLLRIFRPSKIAPAPVVLYLATAGPHRVAECDTACRILAAAGAAAIVVPDVTDGPPATGAVGATLRWIARDGAKRRLDGSRLAVAGDDDRQLVRLLLAHRETNGTANGTANRPALRAAVLLGPALPDIDVLHCTAALLAAALRPDVTPRQQPLPA